jgi:hypothetical protein
MMADLQKKPGINGRAGSLTLEAAIVLPPVLLLCILLLFGLSLMQEKLALIRAVDDTAAEFALILPLENKISDDLTLALQDFVDSTTLNPATRSQLYAIPDSITMIWRDAIRQSGLSQAFRSRLLTKCFGQGEIRYQPEALNVTAELDDSVRTCHITCTFIYHLMGLPLQVSIQAAVPWWPWPGTDKSGGDADKNQVWQLSPLERGKTIRRIFGADLPDDFPVIARFQAGEATAIHSLDLTLPTYQDREEVRRAVRRLVSRLADFSGASYTRSDQEIIIPAAAIKSRRLLLVVPENISQPWLAADLTDLKAAATLSGVSLDIRTYGRSVRLQESPKQGQQE